MCNYSTLKTIKTLAVPFCVVICSLTVYTDFVPKAYNSNCLVEELLPRISREDRVLILRAEMGSYSLLEGLKEKNIAYNELKIYKTDYIERPEVREVTKEKVIVCFTSASTVEGFVRNHPDISKVRGVCIGEQTAATAFAYGIDCEVSEQSTIASMIEKVKEICK